MTFQAGSVFDGFDTIRTQFRVKNQNTKFRCSRNHVFVKIWIRSGRDQICKCRGMSAGAGGGQNEAKQIQHWATIRKHIETIYKNIQIILVRLSTMDIGVHSHLMTRCLVEHERVYLL